MKNKFRKITALFVTLCLIAGMTDLTAVYAAETELDWIGDGSADHPYEISSADHLAAIPQKGMNAHYIQTADITLPDLGAGVSNWTPIGNVSTKYTGTYNGNNKTISNLTINSDTLRYAGLFGYIGSGGVLKNIRLENISINVSAEYASVGGLLGVNGGTVSDCSVSGSVTAIEKGSYVGGLIAYNYMGSVTDSSSSCTVSGHEGKSSFTGGLMGFTYGGSISNSSSTGNVTGAYRAGGLIGSSSGSGRVTNCYSTGNVTGASILPYSYPCSVGGLIGAADTETVISDCYSTGNVSGAPSAGIEYNIGGLAGRYSTGTITNSYSTGSVTLPSGHSSTMQGGFIGFVTSSNTTITNCYSTGDVVNDGPSGGNIGGFIGSVGSYSPTVTNCYYAEMAGSSVRGTALSMAQLKLQASFDGWNFDTDWKIGENVSYPTLQWQSWSADERINADWNALTWNAVKGINAEENNVTVNLTLPKTGAKETTISWAATPDDGTINTDTGAVTRAENENKTITLTAEIGCDGGASRTKNFNLTVKKLDTYNEYDFRKIRTFLEQMSDDGTTKNGVRLNASYDPDDPGTWTGVIWSEDDEKRVARIVWNYKNLAGPMDVSGFEALEHLDCSYNALESLNVSGCTVLENLFCVLNQLVSLDAGNLPALTYLAVGGNQLTSLNVSGSEALNTIECDSNNLTELNVSGLSALQWLYCPYNQISELDLSGNVALRSVDCENNLLTLLDVSGCGLLPELYCSNNRLERLDLRANTNLLDLECGGNPLKELKAILHGHSVELAARGSGYIAIDDGARVALATPENGASFINWTEGESVAGTDAVLAINPGIRGYNLTANFTNTVTYHANGGTGTAPTESNKAAGATFTAANNTFTPPSGKQFKHWNTATNGTGTSYAAGATVTMPAGPLNLYAIWENIPGVGGNGGGSLFPKPTVDSNGNVNASPTLNQTTGVASAGIDIATLNTALSRTSENSGGGKHIEIVLPAVQEASGYQLTLPSSALVSSGENAQYEINTGIGTVTLPGNMLTAEVGAGAQNASLTVTRANTSVLDEETRSLIGSRPVIQLSLSVDGAPYAWRNETAPVTVSIPYTPSAAELANLEAIVIWYIDGSGSIVSVPNGRYDAETGTVTFSTTHFSRFAVSYRLVSFQDVAANAWYGKAVKFIAARDITTGTGSGNFSPNTKLTRGQFIVMLMKTYGIAADVNPKDNFADAGNTYYTDYLAAAKRLGISGGVGNNMYAPGNQITRQEMFTLLYNALKVIGQLPQGDSGKTMLDFTDASQINDWAREAMTVFVSTGTVNGSKGKLTPTGTTTRAEMAQVLYNLLEK